MLANTKILISNLMRYMYFIGLLIFALNMVGLDAASAEFKLHPDNPVFDIGPKGSWDSMYVEAGPITYQDGKFHMFYTGLPKWPDNIAIGYAWSVDGIEWKRNVAPVLTIDDTLYEDQSIVSDSIVVTEDGTWWLYFGIGKRMQDFGGSIGLATSTSPTGPWTVHPEPVLLPGPQGSWDANKILHPDVFRTDDGFTMYYTGYGNEKVGGVQEEHGHIGLATSTNGIDWTKYDDLATTDPFYSVSDPVFSRSAENDWDNWHVKDANVRSVNGQWKMLYHGVTLNTSGNFGFATSEDGINWTRSQGNPVIEAKKAGMKLFFATWLRHKDEDRIYIEGGSDNTTKVHLYAN